MRCPAIDHCVQGVYKKISILTSIHIFCFLYRIVIVKTFILGVQKLSKYYIKCLLGVYKKKISILTNIHIFHFLYRLVLIEIFIQCVLKMSRLSKIISSMCLQGVYNDKQKNKHIYFPFPVASCKNFCKECPTMVYIIFKVS